MEGCVFVKGILFCSCLRLFLCIDFVYELDKRIFEMRESQNKIYTTLVSRSHAEAALGVRGS